MTHQHPDPCGVRLLNPVRPDNRPGLSQIEYRIGTQPEFFERLKWGISRELVHDPETGLATRPLSGLRQRTLTDPATALLDSFSHTLNILSFYSERVANEGYLPTAKERRSLVEFARAVGYEPAPGLAASVHLALEVESADDPYRAVEVASRLQAMSILQEKGELPQIFETVETITARAEWNAIPVRTEHDQNLVLSQKGELFLFDLDNSFDDDQIDAADIVIIASEAELDDYYPVAADLDLGAALQRLQGDAALNDDIEPVLKAINVDELFLRGTGLGLQKGARIAMVGIRTDANGDKAVKTLVVHVAEAAEDNEYGITRLLVREPHAPLGRVRLAPIRRAARLKALALPSTRIPFDGTNVDGFVRSATWQGPALSAFVRMQAWPRAKLLHTIRIRENAIVPETSEPTAGLYVMRDDAAFFGATAVQQGSLGKATETRDPTLFDQAWDGNNSRSIWRDSQGNWLSNNGVDAFVEREIKEIVPDSWAIIEPGTGSPLVLRVASAKTQSRADYAMTAKATGLLFNTPDNKDFDSGSTSRYDSEFKTRTSKIYCVSEPLTLAGTPIREDIAANETTLDLDALYLDLLPGQAISIKGQRTDLDGISDSETLITRDIWHIGGYTRLLVEAGPTNSYRRASVTINANMAKATHGELQSELLGSGNAAIANQSFKLAKAPLTYVSAPNVSGRASTLEIRVDDIVWHEVATLYDAGPNDAVYAVRHENDGTTIIWFGDGINGRRLPTGEQNVTARYRAGLGHDGEVADDAITQLKTKPLGLRAVSNPSAATGSAEAESADMLRRNAPRSVRTLGRAVSVRDYGDFAETYPGVGKARVDVLWSGETQVAHVTISPETDTQFDPASKTLLNFTTSLEKIRDTRAPILVRPCSRRYFQLDARVACHPDYLPDLVKADVKATLLDNFGYTKRQLAQPVSAAEVISTIQNVSGVASVDLNVLAIIEDKVNPNSTTLATILPALPATPSASDSASPAIVPAELLTILPAGIALRMKAPNA